MMKGWKSESARHSLARKGIKTGKQKKKNYNVVEEGHCWNEEKKEYYPIDSISCSEGICKGCYQKVKL